MEELVQLVSARTGIAPEQARAAVETVLSFLKERLPAPLAAQVDGSGAISPDNLTNAVQGLGGLFGRR